MESGISNVRHVGKWRAGRACGREYPGYCWYSVVEVVGSVGSARLPAWPWVAGGGLGRMAA